MNDAQNKTPVVIKSYSNGITLMLDEKAPFDEILSGIRERFKSSGRFFNDAKLVLSFSGRELTDEEVFTVIDTIESSCTAHIVCVAEKDETTESYFETLIVENERQNALDTAMIVRGNVRSGAIVESKNGLVVIGDVHNSAILRAKGSVML